VWLVELQSEPPEFPFDEAEPVTALKGVRIRMHRGGGSGAWCVGNRHQHRRFPPDPDAVQDNYSTSPG